MPRWPRSRAVSSLDASGQQDAAGRSASARTLLVASTGGHLAELVRLAPLIERIGEPLWVTFDSPQSRSLLADEDVIFIRSVAPRDVVNAIRNVWTAAKIFRRHRIEMVISTGSAVALSFLPLARVRGIPAHYVESAARTKAPSTTGALLAAVPGIHVYSQYAAWAGRRWRRGISVFDAFEAGPARDAAVEDLLVVVSLGTLPFRFERLVQAVTRIAKPSWRLIWQVGPNVYEGTTGRVIGLMDAAEFASLCRDADVVISHAGVGSALTALEAGRHPILVARQVSLREHVDDHQSMVAAALDAKGVATAREPEQLTADVVERAAGRTVVQPPTSRRFALSP